MHWSKTFTRVVCKSKNCSDIFLIIKPYQMYADSRLQWAFQAKDKNGLLWTVYGTRTILFHCKMPSDERKDLV